MPELMWALMRMQVQSHSRSLQALLSGHLRKLSGSRQSANQKLLPRHASKNRVDRGKKRTQEPPETQRKALEFVWQAARKGYPVPGYTRAFGNLSMSSSIVTNGYSTGVQAHQIRKFSTPEHLVLPLIDVDDSPLGQAYIDFQQLGQRLIADGAPASQVADQGLIDVTLFFRDRIPHDPVNASTWTSEMLRSFKGTFSDELLLACAVGVRGLMRWFLVPTPENYRDIPSMARPTDFQRLRPHPSWVDLMVFPTFRNALIGNLRDWVEPCVKAGWRILWPHSLEDALFRDARSQRIYLTPEFTQFVVDPKNWLMRRIILLDFAEIEGSEINISED